MLFFNRKRNEARRRLEYARSELEFVRQCPNFCCDVCGPYGHNFFICYQAAVAALQAFLTFHKRSFLSYDRKNRPGVHDLKELVIEAAAISKDFEDCMNAAVTLTSAGGMDREPAPGELDTTVRMAEQIVGMVETHLGAVPYRRD